MIATSYTTKSSTAPRVLVCAVLVAVAGCRPSPVQSVDSRCRQGITSINIRSQAIIFGGASFGSVGQYEKLVGTAHGQVSAQASSNRNVVDLDRAPRNACGMVERSEEHTSEPQSHSDLVCRLLLENKTPPRRPAAPSGPVGA